MKKTAIYIHGYGSSGNTETAVNLRAMLEPEFQVLSPSYSGSDPVAAAKSISELLDTHADTNPVVVGTSLGGFFANYFGRVKNLRTVVINPALTPSTSLEKYNEPAEVLTAYAALEKEVVESLNAPVRAVVIGLKDDVVDPHTNGLTLRDNTQTIFLDMGHRVEPAFYDTVAGVVKAISEQ